MPNNADEQFTAGRNLIYGYFCARDLAQGAHWLEMAAAQNHPKAFVELGCMHFFGRHYPADQERGLTLIRQAIDLGYDSAMNTLGVLYADESFATFDKAAALNWFRRAAEAGDYEGLFNLGLTYEIDGDFAEAAKWYRLSADQNNSEATCNLASLLADGKGLAQNIEEASRLYDWAGDELQYPLGYYGLARLHDEAKYRMQDLAEAAGYYFMAADKGVALAQLRYAELAEMGFGDPNTANDAYVWTRVALEHLPAEEMARAQAMLARITAAMNPEQLTQAESEALSAIAFLRPYGRC